MYKKSEFTKPAYKTGEVAKYLNVTVRTVQEELVDDMMSLIASFSGKLYGMRRGKKEKKNETDKNA